MPLARDTVGLGGGEDWMPRALLKRNALALIALCVGAAIVCMVRPPLVAFTPQPLLALALVALGAAAACVPIPDAKAYGYIARTAGIALIWVTVAWCVLSQTAALTAPTQQLWGTRGLPVAVAAGIWLWWRFANPLLRRAALAFSVPTVLALGMFSISGPPAVGNFSPYYIAIDSSGTVYVTDSAGPVVRVFAANGTLEAKLRPSDALRANTGFSPTGPFKDPDRTGIANVGVPGGGSNSAEKDAFHFCGIAVDSHGTLYVPDFLPQAPTNGVLEFESDGYLKTRLPLPPTYRPAIGCVTVAGDTPYIADVKGTIFTLDASGTEHVRCDVQDSIVGGMSASHDGNTIYALSATRVYACDLRSGAITSWPIVTPPGEQGMYGRTMLALADGRLLITDPTAHRIDVYSAGGHLLGHIGQSGSYPGQLGFLGGLAQDGNGNIYVADEGHRVVQRFTPAWHVTTLYWSPDDDETFFT